MRIFLLVFLFTTTCVYPQTEAPEVEDKELVTKRGNYPINTRYKGGEYLIYNCLDSYYACVDKDGSDYCSEKRDRSIKDKLKSYPCAPLKKFTDKKECLQKNYEVVEALAKKRFCYPKN